MASAFDVPGLVRVRPSCIPNAGLGVYSERTVHVGELLGQYEGQRLTTAEYYERMAHDPRAWLYVLMLEEGDSTIFIDASDPEHANWTRFINEPPYRCQPNVEFTKRGGIRAIRRITRDSELFLNYGDEYWREAKREGIVRSKERVAVKKRDASPKRTQ
jgi:hypothetical protein